MTAVATETFPTQQVPSRGLKTFTIGMAVYTFFVIFAGAMVTSHDAGLSVPDWPQTYGQNMFLFPVYKWVGGIYYEHGHRLVAFGVGTLSFLLAIWTALVEKRKEVRILTYALFGAVICQGLLGGLTVLFGLPDLVSVSHAVLAQTILVLILIIAFTHSKKGCQRTVSLKESGTLHLFQSAIAVAVLVYLQLIVGAIMRHTGSGIALLDFPTMGGSLTPWVDSTMHGLSSVNSFQVGIHLAHRIGGFIVTGAVFLFLNLLNKHRSSLAPRIRIFGYVAASIVLLQFTLGVITVLLERNPVLASVHVVTGAALLSTMAIVALELFSPQLQDEIASA